MTTEQVAAAEVKMSQARDALLNYVESRKTLDRDFYRRLVAQVKKVETEFLKAVEGGISFKQKVASLP